MHAIQDPKSVHTHWYIDHVTGPELREPIREQQADRGGLHKVGAFVGGSLEVRAFCGGLLRGPCLAWYIRGCLAREQHS